MSAEYGRPLYPSYSSNDYYPFDDGDENTGELYRDLLGAINGALSANSEVYLAGVFWLQGEEDANSTTYGPNYYTNLNQLYLNLVDGFGDGFDFVISALSTYIGGASIRPAWDTVRQAQENLASAYDRVHLVDPDDLIDEAGYSASEVFSDAYHYTDVAYEWLADAFFDFFPLGANNPPDAAGDLFATDEDTPLTGNVLNDNGQGPDSDPDGDTLTVVTTPHSDVSNGTLVLNADGSFSYTPDADYHGTDSFTYDISDGNGGTDRATVTIVVNSVNDDPVAADDSGFSTPYATPLDIATGDLIANDDDGDPEHVQTLSITGVGGAVNGTVSLSAGKVTFTPTSGHSGPAQFTYDISDGAGGTDTATVRLTVGANGAPDATADGFATDEDTPLIGNVLHNNGNGPDSDPEGHALTVTLDTDVTNGTLVLNADGSFSYTPDTDHNGTDSFTYDISDGHGGTDRATVTIDVISVNDDPVAADDSGFSTPYATPLDIATGDLIANDDDGDPERAQTLTITGVGGAVNGTVSLTDSMVTFTPTSGYSGPAQFTYDVSDGAGGTDTATVRLTVGANGAPTAVNETFRVDEDTRVSGNVLDNDSDPEDDALKARLVSGPAEGVLVFEADGSFTYEADADLFDLATPGEVIEQTFTYEVSDGHGGVDQATVTLLVTILADGETLSARDSRPLPVTGSDGGEDLILGGRGNDRLYGLDGADTIRGGNGSDVIYGGESADLLSGDAGSDWISGEDGADVLTGGKGKDWLSGGYGNDTLKGGTGSDSLRGGAGDDKLKGGSGKDILIGGSDQDEMFGGAGKDEMGGGTGDDLLKGGDGADLLKGEAGQDEMYGGAGDDVMRGGTGNDRMNGGAGADLLLGGAGNDWLKGGDGADTLEGGTGSDSFVFGLGRGTDSVLDFTDGEDVLVLTGLGFSDVTIGQSGDDATISVGGEVIAVLVDVDASLLTERDFIV